MLRSHAEGDFRRGEGRIEPVGYGPVTLTSQPTEVFRLVALRRPGAVAVEVEGALARKGVVESPRRRRGHAVMAGVVRSKDCLDGRHPQVGMRGSEVASAVARAWRHPLSNLQISHFCARA